MPDDRGDQRELQLIRKPDRDWNTATPWAGDRIGHSYNSLENPIGIETSHAFFSSASSFGYNSLENPIGIETLFPLDAQTPLRLSYNSLENPIGIETGRTSLSS